MTISMICVEMSEVVVYCSLYKNEWQTRPVSEGLAYSVNIFYNKLKCLGLQKHVGILKGRSDTDLSALCKETLQNISYIQHFVSRKKCVESKAL